MSLGPISMAKYKVPTSFAGKIKFPILLANLNEELCPFPDDEDEDYSNFLWFPHPKSCRKYYECFQGIASEWTCPQDQLFDVKSKRCVMKSKAECFRSDMLKVRKTYSLSTPLTLEFVLTANLTGRCT